MNSFFADERDGLRIYRASHLAAVPGLIHGVTTRFGGVSRAPYYGLNLGFGSGDDPASVQENRERLSRRIGVRPDSFRTGQQVHGTAIAVLKDYTTGAGHFLPGVDGLATQLAGLTLLVLSADCALILLCDPTQRAIAAVHAGWRGTVAGAVLAAVRTLAEAFGSDPRRLLALVGPTIGPCCYEIDGPVIRAVQAAFPEDAPDLLLAKGGGKAHLDLWEANRRQLLLAGLRPEAIAVAELCTRCRRQEFYSQRAEGVPTGRFGAFIALT